MRDLVQKIHTKTEFKSDFPKKKETLSNPIQISNTAHDGKYGTLPKNDKAFDKTLVNEYQKNSNSNFELSNCSSFDVPNEFRKSTEKVTVPNSTSADTLCAILATLNEVVKKNPEFARNFVLEGGGQRLRSLIESGSSTGEIVEKFSSQLLASLWHHTELHDFYKKQNMYFPKSSKQSRNMSNSKNEKKKMFPQFLFTPKNDEIFFENNTLNRPMASQGD